MAENSTFTRSLVGTTVFICAGRQIWRQGVPTRQRRSTFVTVRAQELTRNGNIRVVWKSGGYRTTTVL